MFNIAAQNVANVSSCFAVFDKFNYSQYWCLTKRKTASCICYKFNFDSSFCI